MTGYLQDGKAQNKSIPENPYVADGINAAVYVLLTLLTVLTDGFLVSEAPFSFQFLTTIFFTYLALALSSCKEMVLWILWILLLVPFLANM